MLDPKYNPYLSKIFNSPSISELAATGKSEFISNVIKQSGFIDLIKFPVAWNSLFDTVYKYLVHNYRSEYVYKNAVAQKILLGRHSLNTSSLLSEFRVGKSKADIVILNGTSSVYEIKTEYDTLGRLDDQLASYKKVFDFINVITHSSYVDKVRRTVPEEVGILILTKNFTIREIRKSKSNKRNVTPGCIFNSLRKNEYCHIIQKTFGRIPKVPNTEIFKYSKKLFSTLPPEKAHDEMVAVLRSRSDKDSLKNFVNIMPTSLKLAGLRTKLNDSQRSNFTRLLNSTYLPN